MSNIKPTHFVISDLHLGHEKILEFCRPWFKSIEEHDNYIIEQIKKISSNDYLWVLGDVAFKREALFRLNEAKCHKGLIGGNHDNFNADTYLRVFNKIKGVGQTSVDGQKVLLTHIPMHPDQNRWQFNLHGHLHVYHVDDDRYVNVSCEPMDFTPKRIVDVLKERHDA